jgi:ATP:ADP antiporter, AAA family
MSFLRDWLDIRKGEIPVTILMFLYYYLILVTYYFLKPARDSLFLVKLGPAQLPVIFILIAVMVVPVTTLYTRAGRSLKLNQLINTTTIFLIINLMILWWLIQLGYNWVFYLFYIWVSIYGILVTSQYWLFANAIFDPTQAKRIFVPLGVGGILGAITGGEITNIIIKVFNVQTEDLLFFCIGFLTLCIILVNTIWTLNRKQIAADQQTSSRRVRDERHDKFSQVFSTIKGDRYLMFIVGIIAMTMMTASFVDYQFKTIASETYSTKEELTAFFGMFYGRLSLVSIIFQLLLTYRFIRILGVGGIILFLPFGLLVGSAAMIVAPGILAAVLLRGADGSFKYSIDKTGRELLFLPVSLEVKKRTKIFIDMFVDRWFRGLAGAFLLLCTAVLGLTVQQISAVVFIILVFWILVALMIRKEYVNAFRKALERREIDLNELRMHITDAATIQTLTDTLRSNNERQITYALDMLLSVKNVELTSAVLPLLQHRSGTIRKQTQQWKNI